MSSDLIPAIACVVIVALTVGIPALTIIAVKFFRFREREANSEMESRQKSHDRLVAIEERVQRLEDVLTSLDHDVRERLGIGRTTSEGDLVQPPDVPAAKSLGSVRTKAR
jgi:hypothetical protein